VNMYQGKEEDKW